MGITDQIREIGMGEDVGEVQDEAMDIIEFCESPVGLGMGPDQPGISLYPVQKFILKCYYNLELDDSEESIRIPKDWRFIDSDDESDFHNFTEQEYLEYLYSKGRANIEELDDMRRTLILPVGRRSGKCLSPDSLVVTKKGYIRIGELGDLEGETVQDLEIEVAQEGGETGKSDKFYNGKIRETKRIESDVGYEIEGTLNHRVRVMSGNGEIRWKYLADIEEGDWVCIQKNTDMWPEGKVDLRPHHNQKGRKDFDFPDTLEEDHAELLGLLTGDGTWNIDNRTEITVGPYPELRSRLDSHFDVFGGCSKYKDKRNDTTTRFVCNGIGLRQFLDDIGWDIYPDEKSVPWCVLRSPKNVVASYLSGLFEADGYISGSTVGMSAKDRRLLSDVQTLLLNFGIVSSVRPKEVGGETYWRLALRGYKSKKIFLEEIGFLTDRKQSELENSVENGCGGKSNTNSIPNQSQKLRNLRDSATKHNPLVREDESGWNRSKIREAAGNAIKPNCEEDLTYSRIRNILELREEVDADEELFDHFEDILEKDYFFDQVKDVEDSQSKVCDLSVPDGHQFVANGFTNHNTFISGTISAYETYKLLRKKNPQRYYGLPEHAEIQISSVATSRDQAQMLFREVQRHYSSCDYFEKYQTSSTKSYAAFQTPHDKRETGDPEDTGEESIQVSFFSSVSKGIRGTNNIIVIMDEAAFFPSSGEKSAKAVYDAAGPSTAAFSKKDPDDPTKKIGPVEGKIIMISSPFTKEGLFYEKYAQSKSGYKSADDLLMIQAPTWEVNPTIPLEYLQAKFHEDPEIFEREFGAKFTSRSESWIDKESDLQVCIREDLKPETKGQAKEKHYLGLDLAVKEDMTAAVLTKPVEDEKIKLVYHELWQAGSEWEKLNPHLEEPLIEYPRRMKAVDALDFDRIADWIEELSNRFYIEEGLFDRWNGQAFKQKVDKRGLSELEMEKFSRNDQSKMYKAFQQMMLHEAAILYDYILDDRDVVSEHAPYINELLELEADKRSKNITLVEAPEIEGKHDDFADALVRSFWLSLNSMTGKGAKEKKTTAVTTGNHRGSGRRGRRRRNYNRKRY